MSEPPPLPQTSENPLQFTTAEPTTAAAGPSNRQVCALCQQSIAFTYYAVRDKLLCPACAERLQNKPNENSAAQVVKATAMGLAAGLVGALIWFIVRRVAHLEVGLIAILLGYMVGKAVSRGSGGRGGLGYQLLAVALTYICVCANYVPDVVEAMEQIVGPITSFQQIWIVFTTSLRVPFLHGAENIIGLLIIGFALWEAWKFNAPRKLAISGPYQMASTPVA